MNSKKIITIIFHTLAWALFLSIPILFFSNLSGEQHSPYHGDFFGTPAIVSYLLFIGFFYLNAYYLIPSLLTKKKTISYIMTILILVILITSVNALISDLYRSPHLPQRSFMRLFMFRLFPCLSNFAISTSYRIIIDNYQREKKLKEKENETLKTELSFLRSQVSPHFMFNVLNNMVALARKKSDRLEPILIELSNLMRYMLYESDEEKVSVKKEIEYLKSYIDLQILRFGDDIKVDFNVIRNSVLDNYIEPMLFIPLVENAFKHGSGMIEHPEINVQLIINEETIFMRVINKFNNQSAEEKDNNSGIGLSNLKRRLNLLYPDKHDLVISDNNNQFIVTLNLHLK
jgi:two-component system LytT family sensor kinase